MLEKSGIHIKYLQQSQLSLTLSALKQQQMRPLLLLDHFQQTAAPAAVEQSRVEPEPPFIHLHSGLDSIGEKQCELWFSSGHWQQDRIKLQADTELSFCFNQDSLIGSLAIPLAAESSLQSLSQWYYEQIIDFIHTQNKAHLLRMWNYFPAINQIDNALNGSLERYQQFCVGRHNAFAAGAAKEFKYPAASAVGSRCEPHSAKMVIIFIATSRAGKFLENPDQISAYQYPSHYSPKSPSFARASICQSAKLQQLYISGTASIVGHESKFHGDIIRQTQQTIRNLKRLIQHSNEQYSDEKYTAEPFNPFTLASGKLMSGNPAAEASAIKVYLRNPGDLDKVLPIIQEFTSDAENICFLQADICRQELDIEIEMLINRHIS
ncbi:MAG: hypothetical protein KAI22_00660 [Gammaproteobacteria bacterium]|nr:hypothetical protein [Gammaproteobacteria bacterium]